jgi:DNA-binding NarL/FixJ family response regulator
MGRNLEYIAALRNCFRCGEEFRQHDAERLCFSCRKPKKSTREIRTRTLTFREKQVIDLVRQAKANKEIAFELHLTEGTIKEYLNRIFRKLEVKNRTELAVWATAQPEPAAYPNAC